MKKRMNGEGTIYYDATRKLWIGQKTINGKRHKVSSKDKNVLKEKFKNMENNIITNSSMTLLQIVEKVEKEKLAANIISEGTYHRNSNTVKHIMRSNIGNNKLSKITAEQIQFFLNSKVELSQSMIDKIYNMLDIAFKRALKDSIILKNPMEDVEHPTSNKATKDVIAFEIDEQKRLIEYILSANLIQSEKSKYDTATIKNLILLGFFTGMRIGELGAIIYTEDLSVDGFKITKTLTKDINGKVIIGSSTKTGKKKIKQRKKDLKIIPFNTYDKDFVESIIAEQKEIASTNPLNTNNLLFCQKDGKPLVHNSINNIFKRICRDAKVKLDLEKGCHFHMTRHTFATRAIEAGLELLTVARLLGHTSTKQVEETYGHILDKFRNKQLENLNRYYTKENIVFVEKFQRKAL